MYNENIKIYKTLGYAFFVSLVILWFYSLLMHDVFEEWDGVMHYFSGIGFWQTGSYSGWASHFWPPLQPLIISIGNPLIIGKSIAFISGAIILITIYYFLDSFELSQQGKVTVLALVFSSSFFVSSFSIVENHAVESLFYITGFHFFILSEKNKSIKLLMFSAVLVALAGLSRYTSYTLALTLGIYLLSKLNKENAIKFIIFSAVFCMISFSWWVPNLIMNKSPLSTWQYLNIGSRVHPDGAYNWWWINQDDYNGLSDLIISHPKEFVLNLIKNLLHGIMIIAKNLTSNSYTSIALVVFTLIFLLKENKLILTIRDNYILFLATLFFLLISSTAFVFTDALLPLIILSLSVISAILIKNLENNKSFIFFIVFVIVTNFLITVKETFIYIEHQKERGGQLSNLNEVTEVLNKYKSSSSMIASIHPARAYYANTNWIMFPLAGASSICDIINYNYSDKIKNYAPKYPVVLENNPEIDFLIITKDLASLFDFIGDDLEVYTDKCGGKSLETIYKTADTHVVRVVDS